MAGAVALASALSGGSPAAASCIPLADLLPDATSEASAVFVGTVLAAGDVHTEMSVDSWYLGRAPVGTVVVVGGRDPEAITSVDWDPSPGERFVVVAEPMSEGPWVTGTCQQSMPYPELLEALVARYGEPREAPFAATPEPAAPLGSPVVTSDDAAVPVALVDVTPEP
jgi:hypothetical protein